MNKETYGFKSKTSPWHYKRMEKELFDIASSLKFRNSTEGFQNNKPPPPDVLIFPDKINNIYKRTLAQ